jgi:flagellar biosynthesis protein FlhF
MQLRKFIGDTTPAALGAVRQVLGDDAIILANRRVGEQVEIIATGEIDENTLSRARMLIDDAPGEDAERGDARTAVSSTVAASDEAPAESNSAVEQKSQEPARAANHARSAEPKDSAGLEFSAQTTVPAKPDVPVECDATAASNITAESGTRTESHTRVDDRQQTIASLSQQIAAEPSVESSVLLRPIHSGAVFTDAPVAADRNGEAQPSTLPESLLLQLEEQSLRIEQRFQRLEVNLWGARDQLRSRHLKQLLGLGLGAELAVRLVERVSAGTSLDDAMRQSLALLKSSLPIGTDRSLSEPGVTVLSGPTGAGKTPALIKLATQHVKLHGNQSVVIICADAKRIGAFESLQAYGRLLGVPVVQAHDSDELESLLAAFTLKSLVLVDHTLPNHADAMRLPGAIAGDNETRKLRHLFVLQATLQAATVESLLAEHIEAGRMHCVLTHLDQCARLGELFNALIRHHLPVAYWSDNPRVQLPLHKADASVLVATAVAMGRRLPLTPDDEWLMALIQPTQQVVGEPLITTSQALASVNTG